MVNCGPNGPDLARVLKVQVLGPMEHLISELINMLHCALIASRQGGLQGNSNQTQFQVFLGIQPLKRF